MLIEEPGYWPRAVTRIEVYYSLNIYDYKWDNCKDGNIMGSLRVTNERLSDLVSRMVNLKDRIRNIITDSLFYLLTKRKIVKGNAID